MSDITAANVKVTQTFADESPGLMQNGDSLNTPYITFGNGSLTYPTYGVPLPDLGQFRLKFGIKRIHITPTAFTHYWVYDPTPRTANPVAPNGTLRAYALNGGAQMSGAITANTKLYLTVIGA